MKNILYLIAGLIASAALVVMLFCAVFDINIL